MNLTRRQFMHSTAASLGLLVGCGPQSFPQPPPATVKIHRLGYLSTTDPTTQAHNLDIFRLALGELGEVGGQNLIIDYRWGEGNNDRLIEPAAELARLPVDVFVVPSVVVAQLVREATATVPTVVVGVGDLVAAELAASHARPGGNVTGVTTLAPQLLGKRLQLLKEAVPSLARVAVLRDALVTSATLVEAWRRDAQAVGLQVHSMDLRSPADLATAFDAATRAGADALLQGPGPLAAANRAETIRFTARLRWPAMYYQREFVDEGGLMVYTASQTDLWRRAAVHVDKILKGASPADLPIEEPQRFDFVLNLQTAQTLGLTIPQHVLLQATEVIQ